MQKRYPEPPTRATGPHSGLFLECYPLLTTANPSKPQITADNDFTRLAQAVIIQAAKDAAGGDYHADRKSVV
jgi:hypothetical protein